MRISLAASAAMLIAAALTGCGSSDANDDSTEGSSKSSSGSHKSSQSEGFDPTTATLTQVPFCDDVDTSTVAGAIAQDESRVKLLDERQVGKKYKSTTPGAPAYVSTINSCKFGVSDNATMIVLVRPHATQRDFDNTKAFWTPSKGTMSSSKCTVRDDDSVGDPGAVVLCKGAMSTTKGQSMVELFGLVGDSMWECSAFVAKGSTPEKLESPTTDACMTIADQLAA